MAETPGELAAVERFVNTVDLEGGGDADALADPRAATAWLREHGLAAPGETVDARGLRRLVAVREALRALLAAHNGAPVDEAAVSALDAAAGAAPLVARVERGGALRLAPAAGAGGADAAIARLLAIVARAQVAGTWTRLKACTAESCRWAYYDSSRNRSRTWCTMRVCGNRAKARAYRRRAQTR